MHHDPKGKGTDDSMCVAAFLEQMLSDVENANGVPWESIGEMLNWSEESRLSEHVRLMDQITSGYLRAIDNDLFREMLKAESLDVDGSDPEAQARIAELRDEYGFPGLDAAAREQAEELSRLLLRTVPSACNDVEKHLRSETGEALIWTLEHKLSGEAVERV